MHGLYLILLCHILVEFMKTICLLIDVDFEFVWIVIGYYEPYNQYNYKYYNY